MNNCNRCGKEVKKEAKFCPACGQSQITESGVTKSGETVLEKSVQLQQNLNEQLKKNQTVQQLKKESKNYFRWLNAQIKGENTVQIKTIPIFGVVNFLLLIVLNSIAISRSVAEIRYSKEIVLLLSAYFFVFILLFFLIMNKLLKKDVSFLTAFGWLFSPASLAVYVSLFSVLIAFLVTNSFQIVAGLFFLSALIVSLSFTDNIWKREGALGRFSLTLLLLLFSFIVLSFSCLLLGDSQLITIVLFNLFE